MLPTTTRLLVAPRPTASARPTLRCALVRCSATVPRSGHLSPTPCSLSLSLSSRAARVLSTRCTCAARVFIYTRCLLGCTTGPNRSSTGHRARAGASPHGNPRTMSLCRSSATLGWLQGGVQICSAAEGTLCSQAASASSAGQDAPVHGLRRPSVDQSPACPPSEHISATSASPRLPSFLCSI